MIGYLQGTVIYSEAQMSIIHTASGIGYQVNMAQPLIPGKEVEIFVSHIIREQSQDLYGFTSIEDKLFFELLLDVNGVGPKSAFSLVASLGVEQIIQAITFENSNILKSAPGVGKKSADQIILSLKDKVQKMNLGFSAAAPQTSAPKKKVAEKIETKMNPALVKDTLSALVELGFKDQDVLPLIQKHLVNETAKKPEELIKIILKEIR
jgi:Holliday junction DNA helicase RuvA